ncbi:MAG: hypothetical protein HQ581_27945 [Planctomycetes bacterium]|nr:hypothetical protein [Planctomycetota bacterium]
MTRQSQPSESDDAISLKDPVLAGFLAWLIPGLGHFYQGRIAKGLLFFVCILGTFSYGVVLGGNSDVGWGRVVYASLERGNVRLPYFCQIGAGLPAMPALVQAMRIRSGKAAIWGGFMAPPSFSESQSLHNRPTLNELHSKLDRYFELGTVYTMIAGLINILAIYDACAGPVLSVREEDDGEQEDPKKTEKGKDSPELSQDTPDQKQRP